MYIFCIVFVSAFFLFLYIIIVCYIYTYRFSLLNLLSYFSFILLV